MLMSRQQIQIQQQLNYFLKSKPISRKRNVAAYNCSTVSHKDQ